MSDRWTVEAGRHVYFDGQPFISINRAGKTEPVEADSSVHFLVECLNHANMTPDELWARQMGYPRRRPRAKETREASQRNHSMTYGTLPSYDEFIVDIRRPDPDARDEEPYWPEGTLYPMELVDIEEVALVEAYGGLEQFASRYAHKAGFRGDERAIYGLLEFLVDAWNNGNEQAGDLASSILTTLGYEWI